MAGHPAAMPQRIRLQNSNVRVYRETAVANAARTNAMNIGKGNPWSGKTPFGVA
jgi:hypothetical protein